MSPPWWFVMYESVIADERDRDGKTETKRDRERDSPGGLKEAKSHAVNCLWKGQCGRELCLSSSQQPVDSQGLCHSAISKLIMSTDWISLKADSSLVKCPVRLQLANILIAAWAEDSAKPGSDSAHKNWEITNVCCFKPLYLW